MPTSFTEDGATHTPPTTAAETSSTRISWTASERKAPQPCRLYRVETEGIGLKEGMERLHFGCVNVRDFVDVPAEMPDMERQMLVAEARKHCVVEREEQEAITAEVVMSHADAVEQGKVARTIVRNTAIKVHQKWSEMKTKADAEWKHRQEILAATRKEAIKRKRAEKDSTTATSSSKAPRAKKPRAGSMRPPYDALPSEYSRPASPPPPYPAAASNPPIRTPCVPPVARSPAPAAASDPPRAPIETPRAAAREPSSSSGDIRLGAWTSSPKSREQELTTLVKKMQLDDKSDPESDPQA